MKVYDKMFHELLNTIQWDEYKGLNVIRGRYEGQLVTATYNEDVAIIAINENFINFFCPTCRTQNHSMVISASHQEHKMISHVITQIAKGMMDKKVIKLNKEKR
ncbi:hypothetical protein EKK58_07320 [Candidatus Dependentiae bacterium]|nr:MAG: hypothetical protein EKK58_07320 [Candidatus Dependentiae bacterium]